MSEPKVETREEDRLGAEELAERLREFVRDQLREGAEPCDLSYVLSYVATEMGLAIASNPVGVIPVVLEGIAKAAMRQLEARHEGEDHTPDEEPTSLDRTLH